MRETAPEKIGEDVDSKQNSAERPVMALSGGTLAGRHLDLSAASQRGPDEVSRPLRPSRFSPGRSVD